MNVSACYQQPGTIEYITDSQTLTFWRSYRLGYVRTFILLVVLPLKPECLSMNPNSLADVLFTLPFNTCLLTDLNLLAVTSLVGFLNTHLALSNRS